MPYIHGENLQETTNRNQLAKVTEVGMRAGTIIGCHRCDVLLFIPTSTVLNIFVSVFASVSVVVSVVPRVEVSVVGGHGIGRAWELRPPAQSIAKAVGVGDRGGDRWRLWLF